MTVKSITSKAIITLLLLLIFHLAIAQSPVPIHDVITEPGIVKLDNLFRQSDTVAIVRVVSGDTENYDVAIYKATVVKGYKGAAIGQTIYYGPFIGSELGSEYFVFLRDAKDPLAPKMTSGLNYGTVHYKRIFNEGYTEMKSSYECQFDGKEIAQRCDYGVRVCTDYIVLPRTIATFPPMSEDPQFGCRWVRKAAFDSLLDKLALPPATRQ